MDAYEEMTLYFIALFHQVHSNEWNKRKYTQLYSQLIKSKLLSVLFLLHLINFLGFASCSVVIICLTGIIKAIIYNRSNYVVSLE